jgi:hypothetical protein
MRRAVGLAAATTLFVLIAAVPASGSQSPAIADCSAHGRLTRSYPTAQLSTALATMPVDLQEYTNCYEVIKQALLAQVGTVQHRGSTPRGTSGGSSLPVALIVALAVLIIGGGGAGLVAARRRGDRPGG